MKPFAHKYDSGTLHLFHPGQRTGVPWNDLRDFMTAEDMWYKATLKKKGTVGIDDLEHFINWWNNYERSIT